MAKGGLVGFATVILPIRLRVIDCPVTVPRDGGFWVNLPAKPQIDQDGRVRLGPNGKPLYVAVNQWTTDELRRAFSERVIETLRRAHSEFGSGR